MANATRTASKESKYEHAARAAKRIYGGVLTEDGDDFVLALGGKRGFEARFGRWRDASIFVSVTCKGIERSSTYREVLYAVKAIHDHRLFVKR